MRDLRDLRDALRRVDSLEPPDVWQEARRRVREGVGARDPVARPPRARIAAAVAAAAIFVGGAVIAIAALFPRGMVRDPTPAAGPWASMAPGWTRLPKPPFERARPGVTWTGSELVVWGGTSDDQGRSFADGAAFDPATGTWRPLPSSPLSPRSPAVALWTGREVLLWGGITAEDPLNDGAAYDPTADAWRALPVPPGELALPAAWAWTGREMVLFGPVDGYRGTPRMDGLAYSPETDSWRRIGEAPFALNQADAVWTGEEIIVYGSLLNGRHISSTRWAQGLAYDPQGDAWRVLPEHPISPQASSATWTGTAMLVWDYETRSALYDPATNTWREPNALPMRFSECYPDSAATSRAVFASFCGQTAEFDIATERWRPIPPGPTGDSMPPANDRPVAADDVFVVIIESQEGGGRVSVEAWVYTPT